MKDEIKEILDILNRMAKENKESDNPLQATVILFEILYKVLDYITNLQEKVNQYENPDDMTLMFMWCDEKVKDKMKQLQKENERLKENAIHNDKVVDKARWNEMIYKSRCEKAIKYNYELQERYCHSALFDDLVASKIYEITEKQLNILQGSDKDE